MQIGVNMSNKNQILVSSLKFVDSWKVVLTHLWILLEYILHCTKSGQGQGTDKLKNHCDYHMDVNLNFKLDMPQIYSNYHRDFQKLLSSDVRIIKTKIWKSCVNIKDKISVSVVAQLILNESCIVRSTDVLFLCWLCVLIKRKMSRVLRNRYGKKGKLNFDLESG